MRTFVKHNLVALGAAAALLAGAGSALAATQAGPPGSGPRYGMGAGAGVMAGGVVMDAAADYLGLSETALAAARHSGQSLAQIAADRGKSVSGLESALVAAFKTNLDKAVAAGRLTDAQATQALASFRAQVQTTIARTATGPANGRGTGQGLGFGTCGGRR